MPLSIQHITLNSLQEMCGRDTENPRLEFKVDIPVHAQAQVEQKKLGKTVPRDAWWDGGSLGNNGRDELLAEVVAFANAQGGQLILGMDEEAGTGLAKEICPIPRVAELERRFQNCLLDCVEPRLPHLAMRAIEVDSNGNGVLIIEVEPSRLGPHSVKGTLRITTRRADKCTNMTMPEVHEMILRNARRFDEVRQVVAGRLDAFENEFTRFLIKRADMSGPVTDENYQTASLNKRNLCAFGIRVVIVAHDDIGLDRLRSFAELVPRKECVGYWSNGRVEPSMDFLDCWPEIYRGERYLGGVRHVRPLGENALGRQVVHEATREGVVATTVLMIGKVPQRITTPMLAGVLAGCVGMFDRLRSIASRPYMPGEVGVAVLTRNAVQVGPSERTAIARVVGTPTGLLPRISRFPRRTISNAADMSEVMNETARDLLDSGNCFPSDTDEIFAYGSNA